MGDPCVLNISGARAAETKDKPGFWRRQFRTRATRKQTVFDLLLGVVLPIICFAFDPIVFRGDFWGSPLYGNLRFLAYSIAFIEITTLLVWLVRRERVGVHAATLGGILLVGALVSFLIGIIILPFSLIGLLFGVGILGFTPFLTALVFFRNGRRALRLCHEQGGHAGMVGAMLLGMVFVVGGTTAAQLKISQVAAESVAEILKGNTRRVEEATKKLKLINCLTDVGADQMVRAYQSEPDRARRERLARAYQALTGKDIETRLQSLLD